MRRFLSLLCAFMILCTLAFAADFDDGKGFRVVENLGNSYQIVTFDGVSYFKVTDADASAQDIRNGEPVAWTTKEQEEDYINNEMADSPSPADSDVDNVSPAEDINNPVLAEAFANGDSVYVLSGDMPYAESSGTDFPDMQYVGSQLYSLSPATASTSTGFKAALLGVLGDYDTIVTVHQYQSPTGYSSYVTDVQPDFVWLTGASLLLLLIYCLFRLGGALIHG